MSAFAVTVGNAHSDDWYERVTAAENPYAFPDDLDYLAERDNEDIVLLRVIARNHATYPSTLHKLAVDGKKWVCYDVMHNPTAAPLTRYIARMNYFIHHI